MKKINARPSGFEKLFTISLLLMMVALVWTTYEVRSAFFGNDDSARITISPVYDIEAGNSGILWRKGSRMPQGNAAYFMSYNPTVTIVPSIKAGGMVSGEVEGSVSVSVRMEATDESGKPYWSDEVDRKGKEIFLLKGEETYSLEPIVLGIADLKTAAEAIQREIDFRQGKVRVILEMESTFLGNLNGIPVNEEAVIPLAIVFDSTSFTIPTTDEATVNILVEAFGIPALDSGKMINELVKRPYLVVADGLLLLVVIILMFKDILKKRKMKLTPDHKKFKQWITDGSVDPKDQLCIDIHSLEGLVGMAIELEKRVIHDPKKRKYFVIAEGIIYAYDPMRAKALLDNRPQLGKLLIDKGLIHQEQLETSLYHQQRMGIRLGESLIALGFIDECTLHSMLAAQQELDYVELDPMVVNHVGDWLGWISLKEAKALHVLPIGRRNDGKLVVACGDPTMEGVKKAIHEMFGGNTILVVARPSLIREGIERLEKKDQLANVAMVNLDDIHKAPHERITAEEHSEFKTAFGMGQLMVKPLIKAAGIANPLPCELSSLITGMEKAIQAMSEKSRSEGRLPELVDILVASQYLTKNSLDWVNREHTNSSLTIEEFLYVNHLASERTIKNVRMLLKVVDELLKSESLE